MLLYKKQPSEKEFISLDFRNRLADGDTISNIHDVKCIDTEGNDVTSEMIENPIFEGSLVKLWVKGGENGKNYYLKVLIDTSNGEILEGDLKIMIREIGN